jgi:hypothetical protein
MAGVIQRRVGLDLPALLHGRRSPMTTGNHPLAGLGPTAPAWCEPGARPGWDRLAADGSSILSWSRDVGSVWIGCYDRIEDGEWVRSPALIYGELPADGLDAAGARRLAAELLAAADLLDIERTHRERHR